MISQKSYDFLQKSLILVCLTGRNAAMSFCMLKSLLKMALLFITTRRPLIWDQVIQLKDYTFSDLQVSSKKVKQQEDFIMQSFIT